MPRLVPEWESDGFADALALLEPPFDLIPVLGPYCDCFGEVYVAGQGAGQVYTTAQVPLSYDDTTTVLYMPGQVYVAGQGPGQVGGDCECL